MAMRIRIRRVKSEVLATLTLLLGLALPSVAEEPPSSHPAASELGGAWLSVQEAGVLPPGQFEVAFLMDNYDRDPLGIDVVDGSVAMRLGVISRAELYFGYQITRSVSVPGAHPVPSPPLDIVVLDGAVPRAPYRSIYWPMPYLSHYTARVDEMVPGEYTLGTRFSVFRQRGWRPTLALGAQLTGPGTTERFHLAKGSGSGGVDFGFHAAASWRRGRLGVAANLGTTLTSDLDPADRILVVGDAAPSESPIRRPHLLHAGVGLRWRLLRGLSAVAELSGWSPVGGRTPMQADTGAGELLGGVLIEVKRATLAAGLRWHLSPQPHGVTLLTGPLAGGADLSALSDTERARYAGALGSPAPRHDAGLVVLGLPADTPLPEGARRVAETYQTSTRGNLGVALRLSIRLGR